MKKILFLFIFAPLFATVQIHLPDTTAFGGDTLNYPVYAYNLVTADSAFGAHFWISFSNSTITPIYIYPGDLIGDWGLSYSFDSVNSRVNLSLWGGSVPQGNGVFFYIRLAVSNPDTVTLTSINVDSCYILNSVADSIPLTVDSGSITVTPVDVSENHQVGPPVKIKNYLRYVSIEVSVEVAVKVYNPSGRLEKAVVLKPGSYSFKNLTPGIHFLIISGNHFSITRRILLIK